MASLVQEFTELSKRDRHNRLTECNCHLPAALTVTTLGAPLLTLNQKNRLATPRDQHPIAPAANHSGPSPRQRPITAPHLSTLLRVLLGPYSTLPHSGHATLFSIALPNIPPQIQWLPNQQCPKGCLIGSCNPFPQDIAQHFSQKWLPNLASQFSGHATLFRRTLSNISPKRGCRTWLLNTRIMQPFTAGHEKRLLNPISLTI